MQQRREFLQLSAASLAAATLPALAQDAYPSKPITMVVPFPPGGVADTVGRPVAEAMGRALGQPMIVENKGGAGGGIGMAQV
ncbi:MAG: tripartite tricarboxylate transporter substrate binding protein, partial [Hylemonella sp.]